MAELLRFPVTDATGPSADTMPDTAARLLHRLRSMVEAGDETMPQTEPMQRILQKLAAGVIECMLQSRLPRLHALWPEPYKALAHRHLCRQVAGVTDDEITRADEMLGAAVMAATREASVVLGEAFDAEAWTDVLLDVLPPRQERTGEVIDIESLRLIKASQ